MSGYDSRGRWNSGSRPAATDRSGFGRPTYGAYTPRDNGASEDFSGQQYYRDSAYGDVREQRDYSDAQNDGYSANRYYDNPYSRYSQPDTRPSEDYDDDEYGHEAYSSSGDDYSKTEYSSAADNRNSRYSSAHGNGYSSGDAGSYYANSNGYSSNNRYSQRQYGDYRANARGGVPDYSTDSIPNNRGYQSRYNNYNTVYQQSSNDGYDSGNGYSQPQYSYESANGTQRITPTYAKPSGGAAHRFNRVSVWLVLVLLIAIPPVGMALLWSQNSFTLKGRLILSAISICVLLIWCYALFNRSVSDPVSVVGTPETVPVYTSSNATAEPSQTLAPYGAAGGGTVVNAVGTSANTVTNETDSLDVKVYTLTDGAVYYHKYAVCNETSYPSEITLGEALAAGLSPCRRCNPPTYASSAG